MDSDRHEPDMEELSAEECYRKLVSHTVGRVGVVVDRYPMIVPVNYVLDGNTVVIRTAPDTVVVHADQANVTFQVDEFDYSDQSGWSVLLKGRGRTVRIDDTDDLYAHTTATGLKSWAPGDRRLWIRIAVESISGRRIAPGELEWRKNSTAYL